MVVVGVGRVVGCEGGGVGGGVWWGGRREWWGWGEGVGGRGVAAVGVGSWGVVEPGPVVVARVAAVGGKIERAACRDTV